MSRTYRLLTGNRAYADELMAKPLAGSGWRTTADFDDQAGETLVWLYSPGGVLLREIPISPRTMSEISREIEAGEATRITRYRATTGSLTAWTKHRSLEGDGWRLDLHHLRGTMEQHVQLLAPDGRTILTNVMCEPYDTLGERLAAAMDAHHRKYTAPSSEPRTPLICVRHMPTGATLVTLWISGVEYESLAPNWGADEKAVIQPGPDAMTNLRTLLADWQQQLPNARIDSEIPLEVQPPATEVAASVDPPPLITVKLKPNQGVQAALWLSGQEGGDVKGRPAESFSVGPGPDRQALLHGTLRPWLQRHPEARIEADVEIVAAWIEEQREIGRRQLTRATPAKAADPGVREAAQAARKLGQVPPDQPATTRTESANTGEALREIPLAEIGHFPGGNVRERFEGLDEMAASIRELGIIQPLTVNQSGGRYILVAGERRLRAAGMAGLGTVPCRVMYWTEQQALEAMLVENIQREDLSPIEEARAYQRLLPVLSSAIKVAKRVGKSQQHVNEYLHLLELPADLSHQVASRAIGVKAALDYIRRTREQPQAIREKVAQVLADERPSTREAPKVIERVLQQEATARAVPPKQGVEQPPHSSPSAVQPSRSPGIEAQPPEPPRVDPERERARKLAGIGHRFWEKTPGDRWDAVGADRYQTCLFARECYLPLERVFRHWNLRGDLGASSIPKGMGQFCRVNIPEQQVWIKGYDQYASTTELKVNEGRLLVKLTTGGVEAQYQGELAYYRVELRQQDQGGHKSLEQQLVIQDGERHIVLTGSGTAMIRKDLVPLLADLVNDLPALPGEEESP